MNSITELYNKALAHLGAKRLMSPDDTSPLATACGDAYPSDRDYVLRLHHWNCATKRYDLNQLASQPIQIDDATVYQYQLPSDCIRVMECSADDWRIEGRVLITPDSSCSIRYVFRNEVVSSFDAAFAECVALKLAATLALNGVGSRERAIDMERRFVEALNDARYVDALERKRDVHTPEHLVRSRY